MPPAPQPPPPTVLDLLCRKEVVFNGTMSTEPILTRVLACLGFQHELGEDRSPTQLAALLGSTCIKYLKLTRKNPLFYRWLVLRPPTTTNLPRFQRLVDLHASTVLCLDLSFCHEFVTDAELKQLASMCPLLTQCVLWGCHQLTDAGMIDLASTCRYLAFLNFGACTKVTDASLERIGIELLYLDNLHMSGCPLVTDVGITSLSPSSRVVLQLRRTTDPPPVPSEFDLHHMKTQLRKFACNKVTFRRVTVANDELVLHFTSRPKAVDLWCESKPNKFMPRLTSHDGAHHFAGQYVCTSLKVLNVIGCPQVSRAAPAKLKSHHIQLKVLQ